MEFKTCRIISAQPRKSYRDSIENEHLHGWISASVPPRFACRRIAAGRWGTDAAFAAKIPAQGAATADDGDVVLPVVELGASACCRREVPAAWGGAVFVVIRRRSGGCVWLAATSAKIFLVAAEAGTVEAVATAAAITSLTVRRFNGGPAGKDVSLS